MRRLLAALAIALIPVLSGCIAAAIGGAAAGGYMLGEERRTAVVLKDDETIELRAQNRIGEKFPNAHVNTTSYNKLVLLSGEVPNDAAKAEVERIARGVENVRGTYNELTVGPPTALSARANDSYITSKVKARFVDGQRFNPIHVKVVTEAGAVYLMGLVKRKEADDATELARTTTGVQRVVRLFEIQE